jgi:hypothetical protein
MKESSVKFVVHHQGAEKGPWTFNEILKKIETQELEWSDYVYDETKKDWVMILLHPQFAEHFRNTQMANQAPKAAPASEGQPSGKAEWYVLRDDNRYGPFSQLEIIKMLQTKKLHEYDYVWNRPLMSAWQKISEIPDFKPDQIKALKDSGALENEDVFYRRRHARAQYGASIILHNNKEIWRGNSIEVSAGGAGLMIDSDSAQVGETLFLHFKAGDGVPPFNATCTIVSKHKHKSGGYRYGVRFTAISQSVQRAIKKYTDSAA